MDAAVLQGLSNATATFPGGEPVPAIFDRGAEMANVGTLGIQGSDLSLRVATAAVPAGMRDQVVIVADTAAPADSGPYTVGNIVPDGTFSVLVLERAA